MMIEQESGIETALGNIARALVLIGNADTSTDMGALEAHGRALQDSVTHLSESVLTVADALERGLMWIAEAIAKRPA